MGLGYILGTLIYARRGNEVLVMHRRKEPNLGLWIAPGGKVELGESPYETARREMLEESGLTIGKLRLRGLCTEVSPFPEWLWLLFIFETWDFSGELHAELREGDLAWLPIETYLHECPIPQADKIFAPAILHSGEFFQAKFVYDDRLRLSEWIAY